MIDYGRYVIGYGRRYLFDRSIKVGKISGGESIL